MMQDKNIIREIIKWKKINSSFNNLIIKKSLGSKTLLWSIKFSKIKKIRIARW